MTRQQRVLEKAERLVIPTKSEQTRLSELAEFLIKRTKAAAAKHPEVVDVVLGGSFAKGTWLPTNADVDVFVLVDPATKDTEFERVGLMVGSEATAGFPKGKKFAQHPYVEASIRGVKVNVVPCYAVEPQNWKSAADRSPYHVRLVAGLPAEKKTQIRVLKRFMRAVGVYGAEIEVQGFSGYAAEVLIIQNSDFLGVLKHFAELKREGEGAFFSLRDPVDPGRELGKAISNESVGRMVLASREFLKRPSLSFFGTVRGRPKSSIAVEVLALVFSHERLSEDTLWGELRRTLRHLTKAVEDRGFKVARATAASNNIDSSAFLFVPEFQSLPPLAQRLGPSVDRAEETKSFLGANAGRAVMTWVDEDARVRIIQRRQHTRLRDLLRDLAGGKLGPVGASREVGRGMAMSARVLQGPSLRRRARHLGWLGTAVSEIASDTLGTRAD